MEKEAIPCHGCTGSDLFMQPGHITAIQRRKSMIPAEFTNQKGASLIEALLLWQVTVGVIIISLIVPFS